MNNTNGFQNTALGSLSLENNINSHNNTAIGFSSLRNNRGEYNTSLGALSGQTLTNGKSNVVVGKEADVSRKGAINQIVIGANANGLRDNSITLGNSEITNVFMSETKNASLHCGTLTIHNDEGKKTYSLPKSDGKKNQILKTDGKGNLSWNNESNSGGASSLNDLEDCSSSLSNKNIFVGENVGANNTPGVGSTENGTRNTALGIGSLVTNTTGKYNTCYGSDSLRSNTTGSYNVAIGQDALDSNTTGDFNVAVGRMAGDGISSGTGNTCIGSLADVDSNRSYSIALGTNSYVDSDNIMVIGGSGIDDSILEVRAGQAGLTNLGSTNYKFKNAYLDLRNYSSQPDASTLNSTGTGVGGLYALNGVVKIRLS